MEYITELVALLFGAAIGLFIARLRGKGERISKKLQEKIAGQERVFQSIQSKVSAAKGELKTVEAQARARAKEIISEARLTIQKDRADLEKDLARADEHEKLISRQEQEVEKKKEALLKKEEEINALREEVSQAAKKHRSALEEVAKLSQEEAKDKLAAEIEQEYGEHFAKQIDLLKNKAEQDVDDHAKNLLAQAMQRYASEVSSESTATVVQIESDDIKGRIIGKEGRNISAFERATGVDVIIDDTPGAVVITGYDLVRRYIAKLAMEKLIEDGRIQPARIEEVVEQMKKEVGKMMMQFGQRACDDLGISGYHKDLVKIIGRLRFRTSYGQNILKHSVEMAHLAHMLAEEIGADPSVVAEGALLHDIGKALDHEVTGTHVEIGAEICRRYKVRPEVIHCVESHHEDVPMETPEAFVVAAVDSVSGARPGARRESLEAYIKRLRELEETARSFEGVQKAYAISAGREIRVFVNADVVDDLEQRKLAKNIAEKIEQELTYPGVIKINVIRERRIVETAK